MATFEKMYHVSRSNPCSIWAAVIHTKSEEQVSRHLVVEATYALPQQ
jgi:hypothetical protein